MSEKPQQCANCGQWEDEDGFCSCDDKPTDDTKGITPPPQGPVGPGDEAEA